MLRFSPLPTIVFSFSGIQGTSLSGLSVGFTGVSPGAMFLGTRGLVVVTVDEVVSYGGPVRLFRDYFLPGFSRQGRGPCVPVVTCM